MDDFFKTKVGFTIGLLAAIFTIKPLVDAYKSLGFMVLGFNITIEYAYLFLTACLGLAVYFISLQFASNKHVNLFDRISNACYSIALATPPVFGVFWLLTLVMESVGKFITQIPPNVLTGLAAFMTGYLGKSIYVFLTKSIRHKFAAAEKIQERKEDIELLTRASELFKREMYDLSVLEACKVVESVLIRLLNIRGISTVNLSMMGLIKLAEENRLLSRSDIDLLHVIRVSRNKSVHEMNTIDKNTAQKVIQLSKVLLVRLDHTQDVVGYEWLEKNREKVLEQFKSKDTKKAKKSIEMLALAWRNRDGAIWLDLAEFFEVALVNNPTLLIDMFENDDDLLESWLDSLNVQLFHDFVGGEKERLKNVKMEICNSLSSYLQGNDSEHRKNVASRILTEVQLATITEVE